MNDSRPFPGNGRAHLIASAPSHGFPMNVDRHVDLGSDYGSGEWIDEVSGVTIMPCPFSRICLALSLGAVAMASTRTAWGAAAASRESRDRPWHWWKPRQCGLTKRRSGTQRGTRARGEPQIPQPRSVETFTFRRLWNTCYLKPWLRIRDRWKPVVRRRSMLAERPTEPSLYTQYLPQSLRSRPRAVQHPAWRPCPPSPPPRFLSPTDRGRAPEPAVPPKRENMRSRKMSLLSSAARPPSCVQRKTPETRPSVQRRWSQLETHLEARENAVVGRLR